jgi:twitching motility protein PilT
MEKQGSDLHLKEGRKPRIRLNGALKELSDQPELSHGDLQVMMSEITDRDSWINFEENGDLDFAYELDQKVRFRANYFRHHQGYGAIFRMIPTQIRSFTELGLPDVLKKIAGLRCGLILITGPTGSGKSTTLAAMIDFINSCMHKKIVTIEEPVEFLHPQKMSLINHREVGLDTPSFANGLMNAIKSDVDIILVGEMRDRETIELALTAAEMGILVFGTLHTNSATKTIDRIIDAFPMNKKNQIRMILANTLKAVISQQLIRSSDGTSRWAALEILRETPAMGSLILTGETNRLANEIQMNRQEGMTLMDDSLLALVKGGKITNEEAYLKALDKNRFQMFKKGTSR